MCSEYLVQNSTDRPKSAPGPQKGWLDDLSSRIVALEHLILGESAPGETQSADQKLKRNLKRRLESALETVEGFLDEVRRDRGLPLGCPLVGEDRRLVPRRSSESFVIGQSPFLPQATDHTDLSALVSSYPYATRLVNGLLGTLNQVDDAKTGFAQMINEGNEFHRPQDGGGASDPLSYALNLPPRISDDNFFSSTLSADELFASLDSFLENTGNDEAPPLASTSTSSGTNVLFPGRLESGWNRDMNETAFQGTNGSGSEAVAGLAQRVESESDGVSTRRRKSTLFRDVSIFDDMPPNPFLAFAMMSVGSLVEINTPLAKFGFQLFQRCKKLLFPSLETTQLHHSTIEALMLYGRYANVHERSIAYMTMGMCIARAREIGLLLDPQEDDVSGRWDVTTIEVYQVLGRALNMKRVISNEAYPSSSHIPELAGLLTQWLDRFKAANGGCINVDDPVVARAMLLYLNHAVAVAHMTRRPAVRGIYTTPITLVLLFQVGLVHVARIRARVDSAHASVDAETHADALHVNRKWWTVSELLARDLRKVSGGDKSRASSYPWPPWSHRITVLKHVFEFVATYTR
ncbi:hypothetical protein HDU93_008986 [Gonapodya sp. JEL0774]|nr:hypothetical protein HDU93_008986 [Gonapodya sp. JEL0774]